MGIRILSRVLLASALSLLASCGRDSKLSDRLNRIEGRGEETVTSERFIFSQLKSLDRNLQTLAQDVGGDAARFAKQQRRLDEIEGVVKALAGDVSKDRESLEQKISALTFETAQGDKRHAAQLDEIEGAVKALAGDVSKGRESLEQKINALTFETAQGGKWHEAHLAASGNLLERVEEMERSLKALVHSAGAVAAQPSDKAGVTMARWAYVDKFRVERETNDLFQLAPLPPDQDPSQNPDLAAKLAEYQKLENKMQSGMMVRPGVERTPPAEVEDLMKKLGELHVPLAAYLERRQQATNAKDTAIQNAFREFAKGRFDLLIDFTFGDHNIYYKADLPVLDVTNQIIDFMRASHAKKS
jgi:hypothetical protein